MPPSPPDAEAPAAEEPDVVDAESEPSSLATFARSIYFALTAPILVAGAAASASASAMAM